MRVQSLGQEDPLEKGQPTPVFLPGESREQRSLAGYSGSQRVRHDCSDLAHNTKGSEVLLQISTILDVNEVQYVYVWFFPH